LPPQPRYAAPMNAPISIRQPCPPGVCNCGRDLLEQAHAAQLRILALTRLEEKRLLERLENVQSLADLGHMQRRLHEQLGVRVQVMPGVNEVRTMRGIAITIDEMPGLCRKTRQAIPAAIRRALERNPEIAFRLLDAHDLFRDG
jgi:Trp operon repressor